MKSNLEIPARTAQKFNHGRKYVWLVSVDSSAAVQTYTNAAVHV